jgi:hypothetical protein
VHINTVAGSEMLVLDAAKRYPHATFSGLNPGLIKPNIRNNFFGEGALKPRIMESLFGLFTPSAEDYAGRMSTRQSTATQSASSFPSLLPFVFLPRNGWRIEPMPFRLVTTALRRDTDV